jgi:molybdopterin-guanine dinucleotide biosynthesis protein B
VGIASDTKLETALPTVHLDDIPAIAAMMQASAIDIADVPASGVKGS